MSRVPVPSEPQAKNLIEFEGNHIIGRLQEHPEFGGQRYYYRPEPRCRICNAQQVEGLEHNENFREDVDRLLIRHGGKPGPVAQAISYRVETWPEEHRPSYRSIFNHKQRHLTQARVEALQLVADDAADRNVSVYEGKQQLVTNKVVLKKLLLDGWEKIVEGEIQVEDPAQLMLVMRYLDKIEELEGDQGNIAAIRSDAAYLIQAVRDEVPKELWTRVQDRFEHLKRLELGMAAESDEDFDAMEQEIIERDRRERAERSQV